MCNKMTFSALKVTFSSLKVTFRIVKTTFSRLKVTFSGNRETNTKFLFVSRNEFSQLTLIFLMIFWGKRISNNEQEFCSTIRINYYL